MSSIDPKNLGPKVYKEDQVLTRDDMLKLQKHYHTVEKLLYANSQMEDSLKACFGHLTIEELVAWLDAGKPTLSTEGKEDIK